MRVLLVSEGLHELHGALKALVERLTENSVTCECKRVSDRGLKRMRGKGEKLFKRAIRWMRDAKADGYDALILVVDQDGDRNRQKLFDAAQEDQSVPIKRALGIAVRSFDAWMLADEQSLSKVVGRIIQRGPDPEGIFDPKSVCEDLRRLHCSDRSLAEFYADIASTANPAIIEDRCRAGFAPFADRVRKLVNLK
jgi:hypothetical protein